MNKGIASGSFELMLTDSMRVALDHDERDHKAQTRGEHQQGRRHGPRLEHGDGYEGEQHAGNQQHRAQREDRNAHLEKTNLAVDIAQPAEHQQHGAGGEQVDG